MDWTGGHCKFRLLFHIVAIFVEPVVINRLQIRGNSWCGIFCQNLSPIGMNSIKIADIIICSPQQHPQQQQF